MKTLESIWSEQIVPLYKKESQSLKNGKRMSNELIDACRSYCQTADIISDLVYDAISIVRKLRENNMFLHDLDINWGMLENPLYDLDDYVEEIAIPCHEIIDQDLHDAINYVFNEDEFSETDKKQIIHFLEEAGKLTNEWF